MTSIDLYLKVEADLSPEEKPEKFAEELCRILRKVYGVRRAELQSLHRQEAE